MNRAFYFNGTRLTRPEAPMDQYICPICSIPFPTDKSQYLTRQYQICCGKAICNQCKDTEQYWIQYQKGKDIEATSQLVCKICKVPPQSKAMLDLQLKQHVQNSKAWAMVLLADQAYCNNDMELCLALNDRAAALQHPEACYNLGNLYNYGHGVQRNFKRSSHWYQKAIDLDPGHWNAVINLHKLCLRKKNRQQVKSRQQRRQQQQRNNDAKVLKKLVIKTRTSLNVSEQRRMNLRVKEQEAQEEQHKRERKIKDQIKVDDRLIIAQRARRYQEHLCKGKQAKQNARKARAGAITYELDRLKKSFYNEYKY